jgi:hypothetical protein
VLCKQNRLNTLARFPILGTVFCLRLASQTITHTSFLLSQFAANHHPLSKLDCIVGRIHSRFVTTTSSVTIIQHSDIVWIMYHIPREVGMWNLHNISQSAPLSWYEPSRSHELTFYFATQTHHIRVAKQNVGKAKGRYQVSCTTECVQLKKRLFRISLNPL